MKLPVVNFSFKIRFVCYKWKGVTIEQNKQYQKEKDVKCPGTIACS